jgi:hypothetical protein
VGLLCAAAVASHILLDWLGTDRSYAPFGVQALWPLSSDWYVSGWDIFRTTERRHLLTAPSVFHNALTIAQELAILVPCAAAAWLMRRRNRSQ